MPYPFDYHFSHWYKLLPGWGISLSWVLLGLSIAALWILFTKAHEEGWASIVPFYNTFVLFKITWGSGWLFLLLLIPIVHLVIYIITMVKLAHVFGKGGGWACGLIFFSTIFLCIMAFDDKIRYIGINGEYAEDYGPDSAWRNANAQSGYQDPYGAQGGPQQSTYSQSSSDSRYYYKDSADSAPGGPTGAEDNTVPGAQSGAHFCPGCGTKLEHGEKFCPKCGRKQ